MMYSCVLLLARVFEEVGKVGGAVGHELALHYLLPHLDERRCGGSVTLYSMVSLSFLPLPLCSRSGDDNDCFLRTIVFYFNNVPRDARNNGGVAGCAALKDFFNARQPLGNIPANRGGASRVEGAHGELGTRLAYRLRGNSTYRFAKRDRLHGAKSAP